MDRSNNIHSFIIAERVRFIPSRRMMVNELNTQQIKLHLPASSCLEKLLRNPGTIVSQEELILCGWGDKRHAGVSHNTYYQCILHLRKALTVMGLTDIIDTVPRQGLRFNNSVKVTCLFPDADIEQQIDNSVNHDLADQQSGAANNCLSATPAQDETDEAREVLNASAGLCQPPTVYPRTAANNSVAGAGNNTRIWLRYIGVAIALALALFLVINPAYQSDDDAFAAYRQLSGDGCTIFAADQRYTSSEIEEILRTLGLSCADKPLVYFTASPMNARLNIIYCSVYHSKNQSCRSLTIMQNMKTP